MGEGHVSAGRQALIALSVGAALAAQGPAYRERWSYLHLENRRVELLRELAGKPATVRDEVAARLLAPDQDAPFVRIAKALATARAVPADDAFVLRSSLCVFVLPEVADPICANEQCRVTNVSLMLPCNLPLPAGFAVELEVKRIAGDTVWKHRFGNGAPLEDLRMALVSAAVPCGELDDGAYELHVRTMIGDAGPRARDPVLRWTMHVQRGYQARCEKALVRWREASAALSPLARAQLDGLAAPVLAEYHGEAFDVGSVAVADLAGLEAALANVDAGRAVLAGLAGDVLTATPGKDRPLACVLRLPAGLPAADRRGTRPLVVVAAATPGYDTSTRPTAPATRGPRWLATELAGLGADDRFDVAFLESPGAARDYAPDLVAAIDALREVYGTGDRPVVLVADREAATIAALHFAKFEGRLRGIVAVGSGGMSGKVLDDLGTCAVRLVPLAGHPGGESLRRTLEYARHAATEGRHIDVDVLLDFEPPWLFGVPLAMPAIASFVDHLAPR